MSENRTYRRIQPQLEARKKRLAARASRQTRRDIARGVAAGVLFWLTIAAFVCAGLMGVRALDSIRLYLCDQTTALEPAVYISSMLVFGAITGALGALTFEVTRDE